MKNKFITGILLLILIGIFVILGNLLLNNTKPQGLINPDGQKIISTPTPTPTPIIFNFDKTTDLKAELDSINPEVLDSDFENLKKTATSL